MAARSKHALMVAMFGLVCLIMLLWWSRTPRRLNEPYLHYAAEQWRTVRSGNMLEREARKLVGSSALDCGHVTLKASATEVNNCIARAWAAKRAFKAGWELPAIDACVEDGLLGTADGRLYHYQYLEGPFVPDYRRVNIHECQKPFELKADSVTGILDCYDETRTIVRP